MTNDSKPRSTAIWPTRRDYTGCYVRCAERDLIEILFPIDETFGRVEILTRSEARLLARRINQCLDDTVKR